jgi:hypothetical protein
VRRKINGAADAFIGEAVFSDDGDGGVVWHDRGRLRLGDPEVEAFRILRIVTDPDGGAWEVRFHDGRHFHPLDLRSGRCSVEHLCGPDVYSGTYIVHGEDELSVRWEVSGPDGDDTILSTYRRLALAA